MLSCETLKNCLETGTYDERLARLYCCGGDAAALDRARQRAVRALNQFQARFSLDGNAPSALFSGPGRTEIGGNHTDHQHGRVLAASVNLDMLAAAPNGTSIVRIHSEGLSPPWRWI